MHYFSDIHNIVNLETTTTLRGFWFYSEVSTRSDWIGKSNLEIEKEMLKTSGLNVHLKLKLCSTYIFIRFSKDLLAAETFANFLPRLRQNFYLYIIYI